MGLLRKLPEGIHEGLVVKVHKKEGFRHIFYRNEKGTAENLETMRFRLAIAIHLAGGQDEVLEGSIQGTGLELESQVIKLNQAANPSDRGLRNQD